jgi:putative transferase (TIGR04331 family)
MRNWKIDRFYKSRDIFKDILSSLIPQYIPVVYIEGFKDAVNISNKHYGVESKIIFTSHSFYNDDYFKIWLAERLTKSKSRLISGQHGGGYFTCKHFFFEHHQLQVSDYMISWGYSKKNNNKIIPGFNYKVRDKNFISKLDSNKVNLLLIGYLGGAYSSRCFSTFSGPQNIFYLKDQYTFIKNLKKEIKKKILFRPKNIFPQKEILTYKNLSLNINIDNSFKSITDTIQNRKIKICVVTLNSTVFLEMLNINFPTILFTNLKYDQIRDEAKPYYDILMDSGVFFDSPDKAALKINEIWNNVDLWWNSKAIQKSIDYFCARFSKRSEKPVSDLYNIFTRI